MSKQGLDVIHLTDQQTTPQRVTITHACTCRWCLILKAYLGYDNKHEVSGISFLKDTEGRHWIGRVTLPKHMLCISCTWICEA